MRTSIPYHAVNQGASRLFLFLYPGMDLIAIKLFYMLSKASVGNISLQLLDWCLIPKGPTRVCVNVASLPTGLK